MSAAEVTSYWTRFAGMNSMVEYISSAPSQTLPSVVNCSWIWFSCFEHFSIVLWKVGSNCNMSISWNANVLLDFRSWGPKLFTWSMQEWASWLSTFLRTYWISSVPFETLPSVQNCGWIWSWYIFCTFLFLFWKSMLAVLGPSQHCKGVNKTQKLRFRVVDLISAGMSSMIAAICTTWLLEKTLASTTSV